MPRPWRPPPPPAAPPLRLLPLLLLLLALLVQQTRGQELLSFNASANAPLPARSTTSSNYSSSSPSSSPSSPPTTAPTTAAPVSKLHHTISAHTCGIREPATNGSSSSSSSSVRRLRIVMVITSDRYLPVLLNWLLFFHELCPDQSSLYFMCVDKQAESGMRRVGLECHSFAQHGNSASQLPLTANNANKLWLMRARLTKTLLDQGLDVLLSDADALWLQNPFDELERHPTSDLIASRGRFPEDVSRVYGATICMGFVYIKSNPRTRLFYSLLLEHMGRQAHPDDQRDVNQMLLMRGIAYPPPASRPLRYLDSHQPDSGYVWWLGGNGGGGGGGRRFSERDIGSNSTMRITLLPHRTFRRICEGERVATIHESVVAHCYSESKSGDGKMGAGLKYRLWVLRDDWQVVPYTRADEFYARIARDSGGLVGGPAPPAAAAAQHRKLLQQQQQQSTTDGAVGPRRKRRSRFALCHRAQHDNGPLAANVSRLCQQRVHSFTPRQARGAGGAEEADADANNTRPLMLTAADVARLEARGRGAATVV